MARADPFYIIRGEVTDSLSQVQQKMSRFHGLTAANPERKMIGQDVDKECGSIIWQLDQLGEAVDVASQNPSRFNLTHEEINSRRKWIDNTRRQVTGMRDSLKTAVAATSQPLPPENRYVEGNNKFLSNESEKQQLLMKKQDADLDQMEQAVTRIGFIARAVGDELAGQDILVAELDQDVDTTHSRIKATSKKMQDMIRKSGSNAQLVIIVFLIVVLIILGVFAFY